MGIIMSDWNGNYTDEHGVRRNSKHQSIDAGAPPSKQSGCLKWMLLIFVGFCIYAVCCDDKNDSAEVKKEKQEVRENAAGLVDEAGSFLKKTAKEVKESGALDELRKGLNEGITQVREGAKVGAAAGRLEGEVKRAALKEGKSEEEAERLGREAYHAYIAEHGKTLSKISDEPEIPSQAKIEADRAWLHDAMENGLPTGATRPTLSAPQYYDKFYWDYNVYPSAEGVEELWYFYEDALEAGVILAPNE